jgi:hypothetical protein
MPMTLITPDRTGPVAVQPATARSAYHQPASRQPASRQPASRQRSGTAALVSLALLLTQGPAQAASTWLCNLAEAREQVVCEADIGPLDEPIGVAVTRTSPPAADSDLALPDLQGGPTELEWVEHLARSTLCYRGPACVATSARSAWVVARTPPTTGQPAAAQAVRGGSPKSPTARAR